MTASSYQAKWVLLTYKVPRQPAASRVYVWRKLKRLGEPAIVAIGDEVDQSPQVRQHRTSVQVGEWHAPTNECQFQARCILLPYRKNGPRDTANLNHAAGCLAPPRILEIPGEAGSGVDGSGRRQELKSVST